MISPTMTVAEVLERHPETLEVFVRNGFHALTNPFLRHTLAHFVTIEKACERHGVPLGPFLADLDEAASSLEGADAAAVPPCAAACGLPVVAPLTTGAGGPVHPGMNVGEAVSRFPETRPVFVQFFGEGCFTCPSFGREDVRFACGMHGTDVGIFTATCNETIAAVRSPDLEELTLNEILRRHPETARILHRYGLDTCCGGAKGLPEVAATHGLNLGDLSAELRAAMAPPAPHGGKTEVPPTFAV